MGKQKRVSALTGHLLNPYFRFITKAEIFTSPIDIKGNEFAERIYHHFSKWDSALTQPTVVIKIEESPKSANAFLKVSYKNGWANKYAFKDYNQDILLKSLEYSGKSVYLDIVSTKLGDEEDDYPMEAKILD